MKGIEGAQEIQCGGWQSGVISQSVGQSSHPLLAEVIDGDELLSFLGQVALQLVVEGVQFLFPALISQLLDDPVQWLDLLQVLVCADDHKLFLGASDRHIESFQVLEEHSLVRRLLRARDDDDVTVDTLRLINRQHLLHSVLAQMCLQEQLLIEEGCDDCDLGGLDPTVLEVVNDHCADRRLDEILVLKTLSLLEFEAKDNFVSLQEGD